MRRDRKLCIKRDCLVRTCSRHFCHKPKWIKKHINWVDFSVDCNMYKSKDKWREMFAEHWKDQLEDEEDIFE